MPARRHCRICKPASRISPKRRADSGTKRALCRVVTQQELQERTFAFSLAVYRFVRPLFHDAETRHVAQQLVRCSTSVAANYRAACLARSGKEWRARLGVVLEEADESCYWLEFVLRAGMCPAHRDQLDALFEEARQLARILGASYRTSHARSHERNRPSQRRNSETAAPQIDQ
jgi:four helix bundle protein